MSQVRTGRAYPPEYVSVETLAYLLDCNVETVEAHVRSGLLPLPCRLGRLARWRFSDIDAAMKAFGARNHMTSDARQTQHSSVVSDSGVLASRDDPFIAGAKAVGSDPS